MCARSCPGHGRRTESDSFYTDAASFLLSIAMKGFCFCVTAVALLAGGCRTADVNPRAAKAGTGYVDFYADDTSGLCWQIRLIKTGQVQGRTLLEEFKA